MRSAMPSDEQRAGPAQRVNPCRRQPPPMHRLDAPAIRQNGRRPALAASQPRSRRRQLLACSVAVPAQPGLGGEGLGARVIKGAALGSQHADQPATRGDQHLRPPGRRSPQRQRRGEPRKPRHSPWPSPQQQPQAAERHQPQHRPRRRRHPARCPRQFRHAVCNLEHPLDPCSHHRQCRRLESQGRQHPGEDRGRRDHQPHRRHRGEVGRQTVGRHAVEVESRIGRCRQPRHETGEDQRAEVEPHRPSDPATAPACGLSLGARREAAPAQLLIAGDQRGGGGKTHLKAGVHEAQRPERQHHRGRYREAPQRDRRPVDEHRGEGHRQHHEGALRCHRGARKREIARSGADRRHGRQLLRPRTRQPPRRQHQQHPHRSEHQAAQEAHVQPGDGQQMRQARDTQRFAVRLVNMRTVADNDRRRECPLPPRQRRHQGIRQGHAPLRQPNGETVPEPRRLGRLEPLCRRARVAHRAEPLEPRPEPEVVGPGLNRIAGRRKPGEDADALARPRRVPAIRGQQRHAHPPRRRGRIKAIDHHLVEQQPGSAQGRQRQLAHPALDGLLHRPGQHRRRRPMGRQHGQREPRPDGCQRQCGGEPHCSGAPRQPTQQQPERQGGQRAPGRVGLGRQREVEPDAAAHQHGQPEYGAPALDRPRRAPSADLVRRAVLPHKGPGPRTPCRP